MLARRRAAGCAEFTEEQITYALRQVESGTPPADVCRQLGVSEAIFYIWKKKYAHLGVSELRKLRSLEDENARLKRVVADLSLDKHSRLDSSRLSGRSLPSVGGGACAPKVRLNRRHTDCLIPRQLRLAACSYRIRT